MYKALIVVLASYWRDWSVRVRCCVHLSAEACTTDVPAVQLMLHELQVLHGCLQVRLYQQLYQHVTEHLYSAVVLGRLLGCAINTAHILATGCACADLRGALHDIAST